MNHLTTKKVEKTMEKAEKMNNIARKQAKAMLGVKATVTAIILGGALSAYGVYSAVFFAQGWFQNHRIQKQAPIVLQWPLRVEAVQVATSEGKTQASPIVVANSAIINELYRKIRWHESNAGMNKKDPDDLHNYCQRIGKVNEIGWIPVRGEKYCFDDEGVQWAVFSKIFTARLQVMSIKEALCVHNIGQKVSDCDYALNIINTP